MVVQKYNESLGKKVGELANIEDNITKYFPAYKETELPPSDFM